MLYKKIIKFYFLFAALIVLCVFVSCKKTESLPPRADLTLSFNADSTSFSLASAIKSATAAVIKFTSGSMAANSFKFNAVKNGKLMEIITQGNGSVDLFAAEPKVYTITLDTGAYTTVEIKVKLIKSPTIAPLILKGAYTSSSGASIPIEVDLNENTELKVKVKDRLVVDGFNDFNAYLKLYLNRLFTGIAATDVDKATRTNGVLLITSTINKAIYTKIKTNIANAAGGDGVEIFFDD